MNVGAVTLTIDALAVGATVALIASRSRSRRLADALDALRADQRRVATRDPLTGLSNRTTVTTAIDGHLAEGTALAVLFVDVDRFATVNDNLGHDRADAVLIDIAHRIAVELDLAAPTDHLGRFAGDRFLVTTAASAGDAAAVALADRITAAVRRPIVVAGLDVVCTVSIGIATTDPSSGPVAGADLIRNAEAALRRAKATGRGRAVVFQPAQRSATVDRLALAQDLRRALTFDEFEVYFQPVVDLADGTVTGAEALIRWNHPERGVLTPDVWLEAAEHSGVLVDIGRSTLDTSCRRFATLNRSRGDHPLRVSVNLSAAEIRSAGMVDAVQASLQRSHLHPDLLTLEVSEELLADDDTAAVLLELHGLGVRLAIDDFGTGYSSLRQLRRFPVDEIKVHETFTRHAGTADDGVDRAILVAVLDLAAGIGAEVVAEGVTAEGQAEGLRRLGCTTAQGWLYGPAVPFNRFVGFLDRSAGADTDTDTDTGEWDSVTAGDATQAVGSVERAVAPRA